MTLTCTESDEEPNPQALRSDDFDTFFCAREKELLSRIEVAMGKPIARDSVEIEAPAPLEYEEATA
jgi:hypothetical protein